MTFRPSTKCPDCGAPFLTGSETCAYSHQHKRRTCDKGRQLWADALAADEYGKSAKAVRLEHKFNEHRKTCSACNAEVKA